MKKIAFSNQYYGILCPLNNTIFNRRIILLIIFFLIFSRAFDSHSQTPIDLSRPVGTTEGVAGNNGVGGATYTIPIDLPAGVGGYKPPVSLSYSSQGNGNGFSGQGWSLGPISMIGRSGKDVFHDGVSTPVNYLGSNDAFVLDGQRLMLQSGSYGASGSTYGMEQENFSLISAGGGDGNSPETFVVRQKDGTYRDYGWQWSYMRTGTTGDTKVFWLLSSARDAANNEKARFNYAIDETARTFYLSQITYSNYKVDFIYDIKTDWTSAETYISGVALNSKYILNRIDVKKQDDTPIRSYSFSYQYRQKKYFLTSVTEAGADGTTLNPITFTYGENPTTSDVSVSSAYSGFTRETYAADFDGDGMQDIQTYDYTTNTSTGEIWFTKYSIVGDFSSYGGLPAISFKYDYNIATDIPNTNTKVVGTNAAQNPFATYDYDGDGKDDVLLAKFNTDYTFQGVNINYSRYYSLYSGLSYKKMQYNVVPSSSGTSYRYSKNGGSFFASGDFDGDGNVDYILILSNNTGNNFKAFLSTPAKGLFNQEIANFGVGINGATGGYASYKIAESKQIIPINFDGDGKTELLVVRNEGSYIVSINGNSTTGYGSQILHTTTSIQTDYKIYPGDFNGDGNTDLLVRAPNNSSAQWQILYSTGTVFNAVNVTYARTAYLYGDGYSLFHLLTVGDYDNDGKTDIWHSVQEATGSTTHYIYYSNGKSFETSSYSDAVAANAELPSSTADINGDGKPDLLSMRTSGSNYNVRFVMPKPFMEQNLLKAADNLGHRIRFNYSLLNNRYSSGGYGTIYTRSVWNEYDVDDYSSPSPNIRSYAVPKLPVYTLASIYMPNGLGGESYENYQYEDLVLHRQGRGLLGFRRMRVENPGNLYDSTINEINLSKSLLLPVQQKQYSSAAPTAPQISQTSISNSFQLLAGGRFFIKTDRVHTKNYLTNAATDVTNTYDSYGNITQSVVQIGNSDGTNLISLQETATTTTGYGTYAGAPYPGFPTSVSISKTRNGQPTVGKTTNYTYTAQGLPETTTDYAGTPIAQTVTNTYNGLGLLIQSSMSAPGVTTPVTEYVYDGTGNYLLEKKLIGGGITKKTTYTYDTRWGLPLTESSSDGLTTSYVYNVFGDLVQTNFPDGNAVSITRSWETTGNARSSSLTQRTDGSIPVKVYTDILGRTIKTEKRGFGNQWITASKTYNYKGQLESETAPYYSWEPVNITTYAYDSYGRLESSTNSTGTINTSYYAGGGQYEVTTTNASAQSTTKRYDPSSKLVASIDNGIIITFTYDSWGNQLTAPFTTNVYDSYGRKTSMTEVSGTFSYQHNSLGQLTQQTDEVGNVQNITYDVFGRIATQTGAQGTTTNTYYYDPLTGSNNDNLTQVVGFNGDVTTYGYDALQRLTSESVTASGSSLTKTYTYDGKSRLSTTTYPAGFLIRHNYDNNDIETETKYEQGVTVKTLFVATAMNSRGMYTGYNTGNGKAKQVTWDYTNEKPARYFTAGVQDLNLTYQANTGNVLSRNDAIKGLTETFTYTIEDRLKTATVNGVQQFSINFDTDGQGRIWQKTGVGNYDYNLYQGHRLDALSPIGSEPDPDLKMGPQTYNISFTAFKRPQTITHDNGYSVNYSYGADQQRLTSELKYGGTTVATKSYWGNMEGLTKGGISYEVYYVNAGNGLNNIIVKQGGVISIYYTYTDHLGSLTAVTDEVGTIVAEQNFDAWGRKRNPANWTYVSVPAVPDWVYRGFTGHEHIEELGGMVNMNARMYDPTTGQMLAPDNNISFPFRLSGYNRYLYADGNPLKFVDPTGNSFFDFLNPIKKIVSGIKNVMAHSRRGESITFEKGMKYFGQGYLASSIPSVSDLTSEMRDLGDMTAIMVGISKGVFGRGENRWGAYENAMEISLGNSYTDENRNFFGGVAQILNRNNRQVILTNIGHTYSHARNLSGAVTRVEFLGGATFVINDRTPGGFMGVTLGNFIQIDENNPIQGDFQDWVLTQPLYMHEFGHVLDGERAGGFMNFAGILSLISPAKSVPGEPSGVNTHSFRWYERQANKSASKYFNKNYGEYFQNRLGRPFLWDEVLYPTRDRR
ncbi:FG-GAP-like repeat-containing protein [Niabella sp. 22666]|uniref:FG-GAP-like repeat-containing protein n=1 Tax=Niabella sp. 22666 TaxID=3453954 RepID=UPI003F84E6F6